jgi:hypothetical protein
MNRCVLCKVKLSPILLFKMIYILIMFAHRIFISMDRSIGKKKASAVY